ncbi:MAG: malto-oligosyltrehalose trehalohydrolase [Microbacteriaceae bacterium]|nr:malto-oligosyltrehalose trehalohydrolase [Microbacteriaceae bacterium]
MSFEVWAPLAETVTLLLDGTRHPLDASGDGWWGSTLAAVPGARYGYLLDESTTPIPDPRSLRQPDGVHELSEVFDPGAFAWTDAAWTGRQLAGAVIYELHLGTFTPEGTLDSAIDKLDHLVALGVNFVELLPVNGVNGTHNWGYDGVLWYTVTENYGGPTAYQRFVDACHSRGLAVVQDVVYNHLGPSGNYLPLFGPYLHGEGANTWGSSVNLDSPEVRAYILENAALWLDDYHVDALRLDAVHALVDTSPTHILKEMSRETGALSAHLGRPLTLIAESDLNDPQLITPCEGGGAGRGDGGSSGGGRNGGGYEHGSGGYGLQAQWSDDFHHAVHVALTGETTGYYADFKHLDSLAKVLTRGFFHDGTYSSFRGSNHGRPIDTENMPGWRLVVANQNHDQIGNRAIGDRLSATLDFGQLAIAAVLTLTSPFTPMLFMGEEWGASTPWQFFTAHPEPELGKATAEGRIREFAKMGWDPAVVPDPQDPATFERSKLNWAEATEGSHARLLALYRELAVLRRSEPELTDPAFATTNCDYDDAARWFVLRRGVLSIVINFAETSVTLPHVGETLLVTDAAIALSPEGLTLPGHSAAIIRE